MSFRRNDGRIRAQVSLPQDVIDEYGGGFIGLLRPGLYARMLAALPDGVLQTGHEVTGFTDEGGRVIVHGRDHEDVEADVLVGADGLNSVVRTQLWGDDPVRVQKLQLIGGWLFADDVEENITVIAHNRTTQGSYSAIRHDGRWGYEWWMVEAFDPVAPPPNDLKAYARERTRAFAEPLPSLIGATPDEHVFHWNIRDRKPLPQWSKGRVTVIGDAAHPTSPYAAYGAGMSIEDGYFLTAELERMPDVRAALQAFEERRKQHTASVAQQAYYTGFVFHRLPAPLRPLRDLVYDHTPVLQKVVGEATPRQILSQLDEIDAVERRRRQPSFAH